MPRNSVVLLETDDGRALVKRVCDAAGLRVAIVEDLIAAEARQLGKQRKAGLWEEFDRIFDDSLEEGS